MATSAWVAVEAIGTSGALLVSASVFWSQLRDKRRDQASRVSAMFDGAVAEGTPGRHTVKVTVRNRSDQPIYDVFPVVAGHHHVGMEHGGSVAGGATVSYDVLHVQQDDAGTWQRVGVLFMASSERHWTRLPNGRLVDRT